MASPHGTGGPLSRPCDGDGYIDGSGVSHSTFGFAPK
jgi:hypothetical protein